MASGTKSAISHIFGILFWMLLLLVSIYGVFSHIGTANDASERQAKAERVPAVITKVDTNEKKTEKSSSFTPWVSYKFSYKGKEYSPEEWRLYDQWHPNANTKEEADALLRPYEVGKTVDAYVYPDDPSKSFLDPSNPNVFDGFYVMVIYFAGLAFVSLSCLIGLAAKGIAKLSPTVSLSERVVILPSLLAWVIFCDAMMIWYWTHTPPPHSWGSYAWFAIPLGFGLLSLFNWNVFQAVFLACMHIFYFFFSYNSFLNRKKDKSAGQ